jgi:hypothetical protein
MVVVARNETVATTMVAVPTVMITEMTIVMAMATAMATSKVIVISGLNAKFARYGCWDSKQKTKIFSTPIAHDIFYATIR